MFQKYKRKQIAELRPVTQEDITSFFDHHYMIGGNYDVSVSEADIQNGSPKLGDMIARNPNNHNDQWLVAEQYFKDNFEKYE